MTSGAHGADGWHGAPVVVLVEGEVSVVGRVAVVGDVLVPGAVRVVGGGLTGLVVGVVVGEPVVGVEPPGAGWPVVGGTDGRGEVGRVLDGVVRSRAGPAPAEGRSGEVAVSVAGLDPAVAAVWPPAVGAGPLDATADRWGPVAVGGRDALDPPVGRAGRPVPESEA